MVQHIRILAVHLLQREIAERSEKQMDQDMAKGVDEEHGENSANTLTLPPAPSEEERLAHETTHLQFRAWCRI